MVNQLINNLQVNLLNVTGAEHELRVRVGSDVVQVSAVRRVRGLHEGRLRTLRRMPGEIPNNMLP